MDQRLADEIRRLSDIEALRRLKARYCYLVDAGVAGDQAAVDELMSLFVDDARGEYGDFGAYEGREALDGFFRAVVPGLLSYTAHMVHNAVIDVPGDTAKARWYFEVPCTLRQDDRALWLQGRYTEQYARVNGQWMWREILAEFDYATPFDQGWAKKRMLTEEDLG
ncbi:MAG: nuclear transport factor 2 family protein [Desulfatibacillaceae bacterium]